MLSIKIKRWLKSGHSTQEHLDFLYSVIYELADRVEELESQIEEYKNESVDNKEIIVSIDRYI